MRLPRKIKLSDCEKFVKEIINPDNFVDIESVLPIEAAEEKSLVFITSSAKNKELLLHSTKAITVITDVEDNIPEEKCCLISDNPKLSFALIVNSVMDRQERGYIHPTAVIHPKAIVHPSAIIGPYCVIGEAVIGERTRLYPNVTIYDNVQIGNDCIIDSGAVIGAAGFGFVRKKDNVPVPFPQLGGVKIGNNVEVGANACIDRGALKDTIIHDNVKIDNHSQVSHNDEIGANTYIIGTLIAGSVKVGKNCHLAGQWVLNQKKIEDNVTLGAGSVALSGLREGKTYIGWPALPIEKYQKIQYKIKKL